MAIQVSSFPVKRLTKREKASCDNKEECKKKKDVKITIERYQIYSFIVCFVYIVSFSESCWCVLAFSTYYVYVIWEILRDQIIARLGWRRGEKSNIPNLHKEEQSVEYIYIYSYIYRGFLILFPNFLITLYSLDDLEIFPPVIIKSCSDTLWTFKDLNICVICVTSQRILKKINHETYL